MGCDIHPYMEFKINGEWVFIGPVEGDRNYMLFGMLSGVRGADEGFFPQYTYRYPDDATRDMKRLIDDYGVDGHSHTVCTFEKICEWITVKEKDRSITREYLDQLWKKNKEDEVTYNEVAKKSIFFVEEWLTLMESAMKDGFVEDARVILWYDN